VIRDTADVHEFGAEVAADGGEIRMHARPHIVVEPWLTILDAKDNVKDHLAK